MKKYHLAIVPFLCLGATIAQAQYNNPPPPPNGPPPGAEMYVLPPDAGLYFRAGVGPSFYQDGRLNNFGGPVSSPVHYETGLAVDAAVGWAFNRYLSADFQTGAQGTRIDNVPGYTQFHSDVDDIPFMGNVTLSYPIPHTFLVPYIGAGAGGADTFFDAHGFTDGATTVHGEENDVVFAWQAFAGLRFQLAPDMSLGFGYKYFATGNTSYSYPPSPNFNVGFDGVSTHSVMCTFEWRFW
ncbi:MAG TPA: outer membrane beta-barrel protein [Verrucomicrobiae bacterium]|jgi:opacity protein-like surface antigen